MTQNPNEQSELKYELIDKTLSLIQLAHSKGFDSSMNIKSFMLEPWMPIHEIFANTACVALQWWLRTKHNIIVWVEPVPDKKYASYYGKEDESWHSGSTDTNPTYENMFITALKAALNSLPPAAQEHN